MTEDIGEILEKIRIFKDLCKKLGTDNPAEAVRKLIKTREELQERVRKLEEYEDSGR